MYLFLRYVSKTFIGYFITYFNNILNRNAATKTIDQELLFVGNESGKLLAVREIIRKVRHIKMLITVSLNTMQVLNL